MLKKVYIRHREGVPETVNFFAAFDGFRQLGVEIAPFNGFGDIVDFAMELSPDVGICGYIGDTLEALRMMNVEPPAPLDYPESLQRFLGRDVRRSTMGEVRRGGRLFVKPVQHKLFSGIVWDPNDAAARRAVVTVPSEAPVWTSEVIEIASEYRVFVLGGEIVGVKHYKGDWGQAPDRGFIMDAVRTYTKAGAPAAFCLDFGVVRPWLFDCGPCVVQTDTILIEANDAFALGCYGLESTAYAKMMSARWEELTRPDFERRAELMPMGGPRNAR